MQETRFFRQFSNAYFCVNDTSFKQTVHGQIVIRKYSIYSTQQHIHTGLFVCLFIYLFVCLFVCSIFILLSRESDGGRGVARIPCALGRETFLRPPSTKTTEVEVKNSAKVRKNL